VLALTAILFLLVLKRLRAVTLRDKVEAA
jgi:hypothetical protein